MSKCPFITQHLLYKKFKLYVLKNEVKVDNKLTATFKKTDYYVFILDLENVIYYKDLGKITIAGDKINLL